jgi:hypothetical protein
LANNSKGQQAYKAKEPKSSTVSMNKILKGTITQSLLKQKGLKHKKPKPQSPRIHEHIGHTALSPKANELTDKRANRPFGHKPKGQ